MLNLNSRSLTAHFKEKLKQLQMDDPMAQIEDVFPVEIKDMLNAYSEIKPMARAVSK
jgi:hypothetical protein